MLHTFESPVKTAINNGGVVDFEVTINYGRPSRRSDAEKARKEIVPDGNEIADIIEAELHVPTEVQGLAKKISADGTTTLLANSSTSNSIDVNLNHYTISASPRRHLQINSASAAELKCLNGVDDATAEKILAMRPLKDKDDTRRKLGESTWHALASTSGISIRFK